MRLLEMPFGKRPQRIICFKEGDPGEGGAGGFTDEELKNLAAPEGETQIQPPPPPPPAKDIEQDKGQQQQQQQQQPPVPPAGNQQQQPPAGQEYLAPFNMLKQTWGIEVDPTQITPENAAQQLVNTIIENYDWSERIDPKLLAIQEKMATENVPFETAVRQFVPSDTPTNDDEKLSIYFQETLGMNPDEAKAEIESMGNKNIELRRANAYFENRKKIMEQEEQARQQELSQQQFQQTQQIVKEGVKTALAKFDTYTDIWGVQLSRAEKDAFKPVFEKLMIPEKPGEPTLFHQLLDQDETLLRVAYMLVNGNKITNELLSKPEEVRKLIEGKLLADPGVSNSNRKAEEVDDATFYRRMSDPESVIS